LTADKLNNKTIEQLENEKLQAEIDILHARLAKEFPEEKRQRWYDKLAEFARKWAAFVLGTVTLISAIFGVFVPLAEYLEERRNALKYALNENMIGFVDDMMSGDTEKVNRGIMMLSYYEINSIPILLYSLSESESGATRQKIIENIHWIHFDNKNNGIVEMILGRMQYNFEKLKVVNSQGELEVFGASQVAMQNFIDLLKVLKLSNSECEDITVNFEIILDTMNNDPDQFYNENSDAKGVKRKMTGFLENNKYCKQ
jgi:hypothetical protein